MEKVLQENMQGGLTRAQKRVKILKMDVRKTITLHSDEQKELGTPTKNIKIEIWCNTKKSFTKTSYCCHKTRNFTKLIWNPTIKRNF